MTTRDVSDKQEKRLSKLLGGRCQPNSGGTKFGGGDIHTQDFLIEAKCTTKAQKNFTIQKEWLDKAEEQAFEQNKPYSALAIAFDPDGPDYFVIDRRLFYQLLSHLEGRSE